MGIDRDDGRYGVGARDSGLGTRRSLIAAHVGAARARDRAGGGPGACDQATKARRQLPCRNGQRAMRNGDCSTTALRGQSPWEAPPGEGPRSELDARSSPSPSRRGRPAEATEGRKGKGEGGWRPWGLRLNDQRRTRYGGVGRCHHGRRTIGIDRQSALAGRAAGRAAVRRRDGRVDLLAEPQPPEAHRLVVLANSAGSRTAAAGGRDRTSRHAPACRRVLPRVAAPAVSSPVD